MKKTLSKNVADGSGVGTQGIIDAGDGFLIDAGYSVKKDGPGSATRKRILSEVFEGKVDLPFDIKESVAEQWGSPNSFERLQKMRNSINFSLGTQKGRKNPSEQAIRKWEEDLSYIDNILSKDG